MTEVVKKPPNIDHNFLKLEQSLGQNGRFKKIQKPMSTKLEMNRIEYKRIVGNAFRKLTEKSYMTF